MLLPIPMADVVYQSLLILFQYFLAIILHQQKIENNWTRLKNWQLKIGNINLEYDGKIVLAISPLS